MQMNRGLVHQELRPGDSMFRDVPQPADLWLGRVSPKLILTEGCPEIDAHIDYLISIGPLDEPLHRILNEPANYLCLEGKSDGTDLEQPTGKAQILPYIIASLVCSAGVLSSGLRNEELRTAMIRLSVSCHNLPVDLVDVIATRAVKGISSYVRPDQQHILDAVIGSLLTPEQTVLGGVEVPPLNGASYIANIRILSEMLRLLADRQYSEHFWWGIVDYYSVPQQEFVDFCTYLRTCLEQADEERMRSNPQVLMFIQQMFQYIRDPKNMYRPIAGFTAQYVARGTAALFEIGRLVTSMLNTDQSEIPLNSLLSQITEQQLVEAESRFPGLATVSTHSQIKSISSRKIECEGKTYYALSGVSDTGSLKHCIVPADDFLLLLVAIEQMVFFLEDSTECPPIIFQVIKDRLAGGADGPLGLAVGSFGWVTTMGALEYAPTQEGRRKHEEHERWHTVFFQRFPKLSKSISDPSVTEGILYAMHDRVDPHLVQFILLSGAQDSCVSLFDKTWNRDNPAKYSLAYLTWQYIFSNIRQYGVTPLVFLERLECIAAYTELDFASVLNKLGYMLRTG